MGTGFPSENVLKLEFGRIAVSLEGKVALITGAGSGFGEGMAKRFVRDGAKVVIVDRDKAGAERVAGELEMQHWRSLPIFPRKQMLMQQ